MALQKLYWLSLLVEIIFLLQDDLFLQAAMRGNNDLVKSLLDDGADISVVTVDDEGKNVRKFYRASLFDFMYEMSR
jgi:hypothetical protein